MGRWSWAAKVGLLSLRVVCQQQCNRHCLCDSAQTRQLKQQFAQCTSRWAMARGHRLNTSIVLAAVHGLSGLFRAASEVELSLFRPLPPHPPPPVPPPRPNKPPCKMVPWSVEPLASAAGSLLERAENSAIYKRSSIHQKQQQHVMIISGKCIPRVVLHAFWLSSM